MKTISFALALLCFALVGFALVRYAVRDRDPISFFIGLLIFGLAIFGVFFFRLFV